MEETIHRCDMPVKRRGTTETTRHGVVIEDYQGPFEFGVEGKSYEVDLCEEDTQVARDTFTLLISVATEVSPSGQAVRRALKGKQGRFTHKQMRKYLQEQGLEVADSGRLSNDLIDRAVRGLSAQST